MCSEHTCAYPLFRVARWRSSFLIVRPGVSQAFYPMRFIFFRQTQGHL